MKPPHLASIVSVVSLASHEPFWMNSACPGCTSNIVMSPGSLAATSTKPP
ncbi:MAG: hypothetical protein R2713_19010 [Ilumatobacteraceae bacterium]